ncbi:MULTISPECIES: serine hydrolase domain-containing protein [Streptomyces]|uniref:Serine hydrolase domain-containing protein n=1 Tax=Streptomyces doudnae TaxID=3075536 RepID=A0ABD5EGW6_9ACTN|nr:MULTISPECIES: serine hydrolase domain-containing protein [unclassified Streptomyces]MDT0433913.1 serine hydrolase domain-containing protein [Streptomyces sp. DSM 41981]MYQ64659.1 serine hydrolase [Streptomyces sp. SID4950]SCD83592.1 D-alanyl-D-alanine carboxypeptidase [Streptomyces sp. SolWspMP-5a-2]
MPRRATPSRTRLTAVCAVAACLTALAPATARAAAPADPSDGRLQRLAREFVGAPDGPPGLIAVLRDEKGTRVVRAGTADLATGRPPRTGDHMRIASTAKAFSAAVALSLVDRQALGLDDTVGRRLPELPRAWHRVTLRQLLQHTSGLPDYTLSPAFVRQVTTDPHHRFDSRRLLDYVAGDPLGFRPGSRYRYSNSDNIAVALMAESATGTPYEELLKILVDRPLGLRDTTLPQGYRLPRPYLHGYDVAPPAAPEDVSEVLGASGVWASGGIVSTPADLTRFVRGYTGGALYGAPVTREQRRWIAGASEPAGPGRNAAGLGLFRYGTRCGTVLGHTGNFPGYTQLIAATPDGRRSLTFSVTRQINESTAPDLLRRLRAVQEDFVCALLNRR